MDLIVFPEMVLTGYPIDDLLREKDFQTAVEDAQQHLTYSLQGSPPVVIGSPISGDSKYVLDIDILPAVNGGDSWRAQAASGVDASSGR